MISFDLQAFSRKLLRVDICRDVVIHATFHFQEKHQNYDVKHAKNTRFLDKITFGP